MEEYIPPGCFIDRRKFKSYDELASFLNAVSEERYKEYLTNIGDFFNSKKYWHFTPKAFAETLIKGILNK